MVKANPVRGPSDDHEVRLMGAWPPRNDGAPTLVERRDEDFLAALLVELAGSKASELATVHRPGAGPDGVLRLFQPIHRTFNLTLLETHCDTFGRPRLDPRKIDSAGQVVRRVRLGPDGTRHYEAWCSSNHRVIGWQPLPPEDDPDHRRDPDPVRRPLRRITGNAAVDRTHFGERAPLAEDTVSLFVAPPDTAAATGRTLLYGVLPVSSPSRAGPIARGPAPAPDEWTAHLSLLLRSSRHSLHLWPARSTAEQAAVLERNDLRGVAESGLESAAAPAAQRFVALVRQLAQEFGLLRPSNPETARLLRETLNRLNVPLVDGRERPAGDYLQEAARVYFELPRPDLALPRPKEWPAVNEAIAANLLDVLRRMANETELAVFGSADGAGRYDDPTARYVVRAFIRVKQPGGCPPRLVWSPYSEEFSIAPWFESGPVPPVPIPLPELSADFLKKARPNVAFSVPSSLANLMNQDPKKLLDGNAGSGPAVALDWICGFSLPIITVCAFVVLNVFLSLLNLVFFWLPYVKVCVPFPRKK